jgi:hypothetical protein
MTCSTKTGALPARGNGRADAQRLGAVGELAIQDQERQPAEVITVQMRNEDRADLLRVEVAAPQGRQ